MMPLGLILPWLTGKVARVATGPAGQALFVVSFVTVSVVVGGWWLRSDARRVANAVCTAEKELVAAEQANHELDAINKALRADAAARAHALSEREIQLSASEKAINLMKDEADALRNEVNRLDKTAGDAIFARGDRWAERVRGSTKAAPQSGGSR